MRSITIEILRRDVCYVECIGAVGDVLPTGEKLLIDLGEVIHPDHKDPIFGKWNLAHNFLVGKTICSFWKDKKCTINKGAHFVSETAAGFALAVARATGCNCLHNPVMPYLCEHRRMVPA